MKSSAAGHDDEDLAENHEINVTPFIDVMLVLLIIFMIAAPLATVDIPVELPANAAEPKPRAADPIYLTVQANLSWSVNEHDVTSSNLRTTLDATTRGDRDTRVFLRADQSVTYAHLMDAMNALHDAGYLRVALVGLERTRE